MRSFYSITPPLDSTEWTDRRSGSGEESQLKIDDAALTAFAPQFPSCYRLACNCPHGADSRVCGLLETTLGLGANARERALTPEGKALAEISPTESAGVEQPNAIRLALYRC